MTLATRPAHELAPLIRQKQVSPVELMRAVLDRIDRLEPRLNAMAHLDPEAAMTGAREAEAALMRSAPLGRLHGLPVTIKDLADVAGMPTRSGTRTSAATPAPADTPFVERLRHAGAIPIGKNDHVRVRLDRRQHQSADRHHPQPMAARHERRCVLGRGGRGCRRRLRPAASGE